MSTRPYITCNELIEFLHLYVSRELPPDRSAEFDRHLSVCPSCVTRQALRILLEPFFRRAFA